MLVLIAAVANNSCIGHNGTLPWHLPEDLAHFKAITAGHTVLMGRTTWESLPTKFRPLPGRKNLVISRQTNYPVPAGVEVYGSIETALQAHQAETIFVIGGANIYAQTINLADQLYITHVHQTVSGDAFFPPIDQNVWQETDREDHPGFSFVTYTRK